MLLWLFSTGVKYILMQENFQSPFDVKFLLSRSRRRVGRPVDPYAVQPWQKNVLEIEIEEPAPTKNYKTFYHTPLHRPAEKRQDRKYETQRVFSFRKQEENSNIFERVNWGKAQDKNTLGSASQQSTINHYNINGNFLQGLFPTQKRKSSNQFVLRSPQKHSRNKPKSQSKQQEETRVGIANIDEIKRRVDLCRNFSCRQDKKFVQLHSEHFGTFQDKSYLTSPVKRQKKVISLGFRKLSIAPKLLKQKSLSSHPSLFL